MNSNSEPMQVIDQLDKTASSAGMDRANQWTRITVVTQVKSDRVVYFTDDESYQPPMEGDWYYCSSYSGPLPSGMTLRNCWAWKFKGSVFINARESTKKSSAQLLIENNKSALLKILNEKINTVRKAVLPTTMGGDAIRVIKLQEARAFVGSNPTNDESEFKWLLNVASAHHITALQAAQLVIAKAEHTNDVLAESERFREQLQVAIESATTEQELLELREWLLDRVFPALNAEFKFRLPHTEPINVDAPLSERHKIHEIARLKGSLREAINAIRRPLHSDYINNSEVRREKMTQAKRWLELELGAKARLTKSPEEIVAQGYSLLYGYSSARSLPIDEACYLLLNSAQMTNALLTDSERSKDSLLCRIDGIQSMADIERLEKDIQNLIQKK